MKVGRTIPVLLVSFAGAATLWAQQPAPPPPAAQKMEMSGKPGMMEKMDESMMAHHKEMMARMEAMDARLNDLVKKMNAANGSRKAAAVAAVVNELVAQGKQMREQMMAECPMMKSMEPAKDPHSEHHPD